MLKQYVFLVHGMGVHKAGEWHDSYVDALVKTLRLYAPFKEMSEDEIKSDAFEFIPISYDALTDGYRERWEEGAGTVAERIAAESASLGRIIGKLEESAGETEGLEGFFWTHVFDAFLWYTHKEARSRVVAHVVGELGKGLQKMYAEVRTNTAHVVAHSLGTSVVHDALIAMRHWEDDEGLFAPSAHRWVSVSMVANVARMLETRFKVDANLHREAFKVYRSVLDPTHPQTVVEHFLNFRHELDPFTWPRRFAPGTWTTNYEDVRPERVDDPKKVHDFEHYLANPRVHIPLLRAISGRPAMCTGEEATPIWSKFVEDYPVAVTEVFDALKDLFDGDQDSKLTPFETIEYLYETYKLLK